MLPGLVRRGSRGASARRLNRPSLRSARPTHGIDRTTEDSCGRVVPNVVRIRRPFVLALVAAALASGVITYARVRMPGSSHTGPLPPLTAKQRALACELERDVAVLATRVGVRSTATPAGLQAARVFLHDEFTRVGYEVREEVWIERGVECANVIAERRGSSEIVLVGAHYDTALDSPGANDNGSGVAALLALSRRFASRATARTLRFAAFANEEPPCFGTTDMGSARCARGCRERGENVVAMLSLETLGCYSDDPASQRYPTPSLSWFYPSKANFIAFVGNADSADLVREVVGVFRTTTAFPSAGAALPSGIQGVDWSDHRSFWAQGYRALMVTDTAPFRYAHYHTHADTPEKLDYERTARVVEGLERALEHLVGG